MTIKGDPDTLITLGDAGGCTAQYRLIEPGQSGLQQLFRGARIDWSKTIPLTQLEAMTGAKARSADDDTPEQYSSTAAGAKAAAPGGAKVTTPPADFNWHDEHPDCAAVIRDQGLCGSCWTFATTGVLSQRFCAASDEVTGGLMLSPQALLSCDTTCKHASKGKKCSAASALCTCQSGCDGGYTSQAFEFLRQRGSTSENCVAYRAAAGTDPLEGQCGLPGIPAENPDQESILSLIEECQAGTTDDSIVFKARETYALKTEAEIMEDIVLNGPVQASFFVETAFYGYTSGVYSCAGIEDAGLHAVILVGWGTDAGIPYWLIQNSWGASWGQSGYAKIFRGADRTVACNILDFVDAALPDTRGVEFDDTPPTTSTSVPAPTSTGATAPVPGCACRAQQFCTVLAALLAAVALVLI